MQREIYNGKIIAVTETWIRDWQIKNAINYRNFKYLVNFRANY